MKELIIHPHVSGNRAGAEKVQANFTDPETSQFDLTDHEEQAQSTSELRSELEQVETEKPFELPSQWRSGVYTQFKAENESSMLAPGITALSETSLQQGAEATVQEQINMEQVDSALPIQPASQGVTEPQALGSLPVQDSLTLAMQTAAENEAISEKIRVNEQSPTTQGESASKTLLGGLSTQSIANATEQEQLQVTSASNAKELLQPSPNSAQAIPAANQLLNNETVELTKKQVPLFNASSLNTAIASPSKEYPLSSQQPHMPPVAELETLRSSETRVGPALMVETSPTQPTKVKTALEQPNFATTELSRSFSFSSAASSEQATQVQQWRTESLPTNSSEWGQRLLNVLHDKVQLQIGQQVQRAQIRLDPPQLGSIDISISVEGEKTTVHIVASNPQIREAMQQTLEQLRQSLTHAEQSTVDVDISDKHQQHKQTHEFTQEQDIAANQLNDLPTSVEPRQAQQQDWLNRLI